jgi:hypothetical protein
MDRTVDHPTVPAAQAPVLWLLSTHDRSGERVAPDVEMVLTEDAVRAFGEHLAQVRAGLQVSTYSRPFGLSLLTVAARNGRTLNLSRQWSEDELIRGALRVGLDEALRPSGGPTLAEQSLFDDVREIAEERDEARTEVLQLRAALAEANARQVFLCDVIAELRAAESAPAGSALALVA